MTDYCILWNNLPVETWTDEYSSISISYSDIKGGGSGEGNIDEDPLFVKGPQHDYYLGQFASGQAQDSPCVDAGNDSAENLGLDELTTRTDGIDDTGIVDMGYHAPYSLWINSISLDGNNVVIQWNARPGISYIVKWSDDLITWNDVTVGETGIWTDIGGAACTTKFYGVME